MRNRDSPVCGLCKDGVGSEDAFSQDHMFGHGPSAKTLSLKLAQYTCPVHLCIAVQSPVSVPQMS